MNIKGYELIRTCQACPEQYDVFKENKLVGYMRLRWGFFSASLCEKAADGEVMGDTVYTKDFNSTNPMFGIFPSHTIRMDCLKAAIDALDAELKKEKTEN